MQLLDFVICTLNSNGMLVVTWSEVTAIFQLILVTVTCMLIFIQYVRESIQMYNIRKTWQQNRYTKLFFQEGLVYYFL